MVTLSKSVNQKEKTSPLAMVWSLANEARWYKKRSRGAGGRWVWRTWKTSRRTSVGKIGDATGIPVENGKAGGSHAVHASGHNAEWSALHLQLQPRFFSATSLPKSPAHRGSKLLQQT